MSITFNNSAFYGNATFLGNLPREIQKTQTVDPCSIRSIRIQPESISAMLCSHKENTLQVRLDVSGVGSTEVGLEVLVTDNMIAVSVTGIEDPRIQMVNLVIFVPEKDFSQYHICQ